MQASGRIVLLLSGWLSGVLPSAPGNSPPSSLPPAVSASSRLVAVRGLLLGQADGPVSLRFQAYVPASAPLYNDLILLADETHTVDVRGGWFEGWVPLTPQALAGHSSVYVSYAFAAAPDLPIGWLPLPGAAFAMRLSEGALGRANDSSPALMLANTVGPALSVTTSGSHSPAASFTAAGRTAIGVDASSGGKGGRGAVALAGNVNGAAVGLEGQAKSSDGAAGLFVNAGGGDLIQAGRGDGSPPVFRVDNAGSVYQEGKRMEQYGPRGPKGPQGPDGPPGGPGQTGPQGPTMSFCLDVEGVSCLGRCLSPFTLKQALLSPCTVTSQTGTCAWAGQNGACCLCGI